jgi:hypothetical protein
MYLLLTYKKKFGSVCVLFEWTVACGSRKMNLCGYYCSCEREEDTQS